MAHWLASRSVQHNVAFCRCPSVQSFLYIQIRGKKVAKQEKSKKSKREMQKEMMRDYMKKVELEKLVQDATLKAAKKGEALDPEMLNPIRKRPSPILSSEEQERRFLMVKSWSRLQMEKHKRDQLLLQGLMQSRQRALTELKKISFPLYVKALELKPDLFPFECEGPKSTPPKTGYEPPEPE